VAGVRLFAALRELAGASHVDVPGDSVDDLVQALEEKFGSRFGEIARAGTVVVDGERASFDRRLHGAEEVALLPPVSGGGGRPRPQRVLLVVNPVARTVSRAKLDVIEKALAADFKLDVDETTGRGHAMELARDAAADGHDLVVVFSGDGTVNEAINGLAGTETGIGIIPGGATNVLARVLGIPDDPVEATGLLIGWALEGRGRLIPVGNAGGRRFAFACGIGLDAEAMARVDQAHAPSKEAYERAALSAVLRSALLRYAGRDPELSVRVDDRKPIDAISVLIGRSNPYTYYKRWGLKVTPRATLDGGLDVLTARRLRRRSALRLVVQLFGSGKHVNRRDMDYVHDASLVTIEGRSGQPFPLLVDGDYLGTRERLTVTVERDALWVVA
jgi:diacylglycerol kinase family enzyme/molybdopterin converting factor small subunit